MFLPSPTQLVAGALVAALLALGLTGWALKRAWADVATYRVNERQYQQTLRDLGQDLDEAYERADRLEQLMTRSRREQSRLARELSRAQRNLAELERTDDEVADYLRRCNRLPRALFVCLRSRSCGGEAGSGPATAAVSTDAADTGAGTGRGGAD